MIMMMMMNGYSWIERKGFHNVIIINMSSSYDRDALIVKIRLMLTLKKMLKKT